MYILLEPMEITIATLNGGERRYILSKFPAMAGRKILSRLSKSKNTEDDPADNCMMPDILRYVAVKVEGRETPLRLATRELVHCHVPDGWTLLRIEKEMLAYNTSFMRGWQRLDFLRRIGTDSSTEDYRNIDSLIGKVIEGRRATLGQLRTEYTIEDAMRIWEATVVPEFNNYMAHKEAQRIAGR